MENIVTTVFSSILDAIIFIFNTDVIIIVKF